MANDPTKKPGSGFDEHYIQHMITSMGDGLLLAKIDDNEIFINPAARRMLGIAHDGPVDRNYLKDTLGFYPFDLVNAALEGQESLREEVTIGDVELHSLVSPVKSPSGDVIGVVVVLRDLTEAHAIAKRQREFVSIVSHELRTPLTSISGALDIALSDYAGRLNSKQKQYINLARESCSKLNIIIDDLLDIARSERGTIAIHFAPLALDELAHDVVRRYLPAANAKDITLNLKALQPNLRIAGDPDRLTQVLNNLLSNAIKFTPASGTIQVEVFGNEADNSHVGLSVFNNGAPIPVADRERIFEKFQQLEDTSTRQVGGTGLGLAISRAIIEAHGGRIWVDSVANNTGSKFVFMLPKAPEPTEDFRPPEIDFQSTKIPIEGGTVLLVTSDQYSSYILKGLLMGSGHKVLVAYDADQALIIAREHTPALAVIHNPIHPDALALIKILKHDLKQKNRRTGSLQSQRA